MIKRFINKLYKLYYTSSSDRFLMYINRGGVKVGTGTVVLDPRRIDIDMSRPELLEIGSHVFLHRYTTIMTHDWASWCFVEKYNDFIPSHGKVKIGNNVWLGEHVTILKNVTIGNNVIIGYGSIVTKDIPSNSVAVGTPAKVICSIDEYYEKRKRQYVDECIEYAEAIIDSGREPSAEDFYDDYPAFVGADNYEKYSYPYINIFDKSQFETWKKNHLPEFNGFEDFIRYIKLRHKS